MKLLMGKQEDICRKFHAAGSRPDSGLVFSKCS